MSRLVRKFGSSHKMDLTHEYYTLRNKEAFASLYNNKQLKPLKDCLTAEASEHYKNRQPELSKDCFASPLINPSLNISSMGIGTYKGDHSQNILVLNIISIKF